MTSALKSRPARVSDKISSATAKLRKIALSGPFMFFAVGLNFLLYQLDCINAIIVMNALAIVLFLVCFRDVLPCLLPFLSVCFGTINYYSLTPDGLKKLLPLAAIGAVALVLHMVIYPVKKEDIRIGKQFWSMFAIGVAATLAGANLVNAETYFSLKNVYYVLALGFGALAAYVFVLNYLPSDKKAAKKEFSACIYFGGLFGVLQMAALLYAVLSGKEPVEFLARQRYRNNFAALMLMLAPFSFYQSFAGNRRFLGYFMGVLQAASACVTLSRAGFVTAIAVVAACGVFCILFSDYKNRKFYVKTFVVTVICAGLVLVLADNYFDILSKRFDGAGSDVRTKIWKLGFSVFKEHPLLGAGWMAEGNSEYVSTGSFSIYWYHNSFVQIAASTGMLGILCYGFGYVQKIYSIISKPFTAFKFFVAVTFGGYMMMNMLHPIEFTPVPYLILMTIAFAAMEVFDEKATDGEKLKFMGKSEIAAYYPSSK